MILADLRNPGVGSAIIPWAQDGGDGNHRVMEEQLHTNTICTWVYMMMIYVRAIRMMWVIN
jgi:hypothetical protein